MQLASHCPEAGHIVLRQRSICCQAACPEHLHPIHVVGLVACRRIEVETDLFKGCAIIWLANLDTSPEGLFAGQRRRTAITVQGRFKQELSFDDVLTGQEFARPAKNLPAKWLVESVLIQVSVQGAALVQDARGMGMQSLCAGLHASNSTCVPPS